jgi:hypothetical protein
MADSFPQAPAPKVPGFIRFPAVLSSQNRVYGLTPRNTLRPISAETLDGALPRFKPGTPSVVSIRYQPAGIQRYHLYDGGLNFVPTAPIGAGRQGQKLTLKMQVLDDTIFIQDLPRIFLTNKNMIPWMAKAMTVIGVSARGDDVELQFEQVPDFEGMSRFSVTTKRTDKLRSRDGRTSLDLELVDTFGTKKIFRVYHNGSGPAWMGFSHGSRFDRINCMGWDGVRLRIGYRDKPGEVLTSTLYLADPAWLYLSKPTQEEIRLPNLRPIETLEFFDVQVKRGLEKSMIDSGSAYDHGRIGAEIAYNVATQNLGFTNVGMADPALGGSDLEAPRLGVHFEARMLVRTRSMPKGTQIEEITRHLNQMLIKLRRTLSWSKSRRLGIAILSYQNSDQIRTIIAKATNYRK